MLFFCSVGVSTNVRLARINSGFDLNIALVQCCQLSAFVAKSSRFSDPLAPFFALKAPFVRTKRAVFALLAPFGRTKIVGNTALVEFYARVS